MRNMKVTTFVALTLFCVLASYHAIAQSSATFTLHLTSVSSQDANGKDGIVAVTMTNISEHDIGYAVIAQIGIFSFQVSHEIGNTVKETKYGIRLHGTDPNAPPRALSSVMGALLKSRKSLTQKIELGKEYDLSAPSVYKVYATRVDPETGILVTSNKIQFTVLPK